MEVRSVVDWCFLCRTALNSSPYCPSAGCIHIKEINLWTLSLIPFISISLVVLAKATHKVLQSVRPNAEAMRRTVNYVWRKLAADSKVYRLHLFRLTWLPRSPTSPESDGTPVTETLASQPELIELPLWSVWTHVKTWRTPRGDEKHMLAGSHGGRPMASGTYGEIMSSGMNPASCV